MGYFDGGFIGLAKGIVYLIRKLIGIVLVLAIGGAIVYGLWSVHWALGVVAALFLLYCFNRAIE
jgi:hypothetical protein